MKNTRQWTKWLVVALVILLAGNLLAAISSTEREALLMLYSSTAGDQWTNNDGWRTEPVDGEGFALPGTEGTWHGISVANFEGTDHVYNVDLVSNNLNGTIPAALADLTYLSSMSLDKNSLSGSIPAELASMSLVQLTLTGNKLSGEIPAGLKNISFSWFDVYYNALYTTDLELIEVLHTYQPNFENTQTLAPTNITAQMLGASSIQVSWTPINYFFHDGGYHVYYSTTSGGPYTLAGTTSDKSASSLTVSGLTASVPYYFVVQTQTEPHVNNPNTVISDLTSEVSGEIDPERAALIALYNSTNGDTWFINTGWKTEPLSVDGFALQGTEGSWYGVTFAEVDGSDHVTKIGLQANNLSGTISSEVGNLSQLTELYLFSNQLTGSIPTELGNLSHLVYLYLQGNQLSSSIPSELGNITFLGYLDISDNQLVGSIPSTLGNMGDLNMLKLSSNSLIGSIPTEFGDMVSLQILALNGNILSGSIPTELTNLISLSDTDIGYNALYTDDATLSSFLTSKDPDWAATQTVFPADITATMTGADEITLNWTPIAFTDYNGGYFVYFSETSGGPYQIYTVVMPKSVASTRVSGLTPGLPYYFVLRTATEAHENNSNAVYSARSAQVQGIISVDETKLMATPLAGFPGTTVNFSNACGGKVNRFLWDFGDGTIEGYRHGTMSGQKVHPSHTYGDTGDFTVSMTAFGWEGAPPDTLIMPNLVCISEDYAPLAVMEGAETHAGYGWEKTIDQDVFNISGKMTADLPDVECVYSFTDSTLRNVNRVRLFIDDIYKKNYPGHLTNKFEVWVSVDNVSWTQALATSIPWEYRGTFADFTFAPVLGRYVKLKLTEPHNPNADIIQLTEFQVFGAKSEDTTLEKTLLADNAPITEYKLAQNYPNPFNPTTTISFALPEAAHVSLQVYSVTGRMVAELVNGHQDAGRHQVVFNAASLSSGVYFCVMRAANMEQVNRMILMK